MNFVCELSLNTVPLIHQPRALFFSHLAVKPKYCTLSTRSGQDQNTPLENALIPLISYLIPLWYHISLVHCSILCTTETRLDKLKYFSSENTIVPVCFLVNLKKTPFTAEIFLSGVLSVLKPFVYKRGKNLFPSGDRFEPVIFSRDLGHEDWAKF
jgi:hypothetical protein